MIEKNIIFSELYIATEDKKKCNILNELLAVCGAIYL